MSFFEVPDPPEPPPRPDTPERPVWAGPPPGVLPGLSTQRRVLFRTDEVHLTADRFAVYPDGIEFTLTLMFASPQHGHWHDPWEPRHNHGGEIANDSLRFGVSFSDGSKWTNLDRRNLTLEMEGPVVMQTSASGGSDKFETQFWIWPLPPEGPLTFVAEWPARGIAEQLVEIDATELRERSKEAEVVWS